MTTVVSAELKARVEAKIREGLAAANTFYNQTFPFPVIKYDLRGTVAGRAKLQQWVIHLNPTLLVENVDTFIRRTPNHELAHLIAFRVYKREETGHGAKWKFIMSNIMKQAPERCHSYDTTTIRERTGGTVSFDCKCTVHKVTQRKARNILNAMVTGNQYRCRQCKTPLSLSEQQTIVQQQIVPLPSPTNPVRPATQADGLSKLERARQIYRRAYQAGQTRQQVLDMFKSVVGLTPAGANTYFNNLKKEIGILA
jgi:SprT protein